ncbi:hypothetical protein Pmar_PMAR005498 [Perkinsus marinus ATCC 50983]|uniref:Uncharacterized protein n=1 Tax=Perkinsus marinus (strain ATCC 50983 / TXsc) TaxID=423536 RepID=C5KDF0_PERM5|nr:hypothetical protein Pmar_PMAR005498 [Perkinsus marinus ATCC 50983]EER17494.1 hypothetical protein Pmar_PMAR005498 [Perkinsus marinus ATCC 50983]|eukprot:XP_002785698.1 hypothetical protein Pmar_PMAR005498 [Perkinsus marinus ATCC 50983]
MSNTSSIDASSPTTACAVCEASNPATTNTSSTFICEVCSDIISASYDIADDEMLTKVTMEKYDAFYKQFESATNSELPN